MSRRAEPPGWAGERRLDPHALEVALEAISREEAARRHLVVHLSGAHAYGFPSPDSDLDLKAIHIAPTRALLGLQPPRPTVDHTTVERGVELDYTSNEIGHALSGILGGNGNFLERVLGRTTLLADEPLLERLRALAPAFLSRRAHAHYRGFAHQQRRELDKRPTVKHLLYVLRTLATGIWLLESGELVIDLGQLIGLVGLRGPSGADGPEGLIARKLAGEREPLDDATREAWLPVTDALFARIDAARDASVLPPEPPDPAAIDAFLVEIRLAALE